MLFLSSEIDCFFSEIGNTLMRTQGRKKTHVFFGNVWPKSNARAHLKQSGQIACASFTMLGANAKRYPFMQLFSVTFCNI